MLLGEYSNQTNKTDTKKEQKNYSTQQQLFWRFSLFNYLSHTQRIHGNVFVMFDIERTLPGMRFDFERNEKKLTSISCYHLVIQEFHNFFTI